jgi:hypothetical protein
VRSELLQKPAADTTDYWTERQKHPTSRSQQQSRPVPFFDKRASTQLAPIPPQPPPQAESTRLCAIDPKVLACACRELLQSPPPEPSRVPPAAFILRVRQCEHLIQHVAWPGAEEDGFARTRRARRGGLCGRSKRSRRPLDALASRRRPLLAPEESVVYPPPPTHSCVCRSTSMGEGRVALSVAPSSACPTAGGSAGVLRPHSMPTSLSHNQPPDTWNGSTGLLNTMHWGASFGRVRVTAAKSESDTHTHTRHAFPGPLPPFSTKK